MKIFYIFKIAIGCIAVIYVMQTTDFRHYHMVLILVSVVVIVGNIIGLFMPEEKTK